MKPIPISAAEHIAKEYGYDQVVIIARKVGNDPDPHGEHVTTYGVDKGHCDVAAHMGNFLKYKVMGWMRDGEQPATDAPRIEGERPNWTFAGFNVVRDRCLHPDTMMVGDRVFTGLGGGDQ
jgi:hypothetical protein